MKTKYSYGKTYLIIVSFEEYLVFNLEVLTFVDLWNFVQKIKKKEKTL